MTKYNMEHLNIAAVLLVILISRTGAENSATNTLSGRYFRFCFPSNKGPRHKYRSMRLQLHPAIYVHDVTTVNITSPGIQSSFQVTLNPGGEVKTATAPGGVEANKEETLQVGTITVTSDHDIYVTAISDVESSLATTPIPPFDSASGHEFIIANYHPAPVYPSLIVLTTDTSPATVVMKKSQGMTFNDLLFPGEFEYTEYSDIIRFVIPPNQSVQLHCEWDCTGVKITSDTPISVLSAGECTFVTKHDFGCDHIAAFMPSIDRLGQHFTMGKFMSRESGYIARVVATEDDTNVTVSSVGTLTMKAGQYYDKDITDSSAITIISTKPILTVQFAKGHTSDNRRGDPFMMVVPPQKQYVNSITFANFGSLGRYQLSSFLSIVIESKHVDELLFNGESITWGRFDRIGEMCVIGKELMRNGINHISHTSKKAKFAAFVYGFGEDISFGHALDHHFIRFTEPVVPNAYCPEDVTEDDVLGTLSWPRTKAGIIAHSHLRCPLDSERGGEGKATRLCSFDEQQIAATWQPHEIHSCGEERQVELGDLPEIPVVEDNVEEVANALEDFTEDMETLTSNDIANVADTLNNIVAVETPSKEVTSLVVETVNNLMVGEIIPSEQSSNSTSSIIRSLEHQIEISLQSSNTLRVVAPAIAVDAVTINTTEEGQVTDIVGGVTFFVKHDQDKEGFVDQNVQTSLNMSQVPESVETSIVLPENLFTGMKGGQQLSFKVYQDDLLFLSGKDQSLTVAGSVVSADIHGSKSSKLKEPVLIRFLPHQINDLESVDANTTLCVFWDFTLQNGVGDWSTEGCTMVGLENDRVVCRCNHLTNFAVLVDVTGHTLTGAKAIALDVITYVGCAISMLALVLTLAIFLGFRKLRSSRQRFILIHFCISLLCLYIVFIAGIDTAVNCKVGCVIVAALIHYFTLTTMMWMGVEARNLYAKLVTVLGAEKDWFMKVSILIAWGLPLLVVGVTVGIGYDNYTSDYYCFITPGPMLYYTLLLPIGLLVLHNVTTFILIMYSIHQTRMNTSRHKETSRKEELYARLQNAITISVLLGLTWVFGFFAIEGATFAFQLLFCIFNSLQGLLIFVLFCYRAEDVRKAVEPYCGWMRKSDVSRDTSSYTAGKKETSSSAVST